MTSRALLCVLAGLGWADAQAADRLVELGCEPSRACAIQLAREAGRANYKVRKNNHEYVMALLAIADMQSATGDKPGFAASVTEIRQAIDGFEGGKDQVGYRASLAVTQAREGLLEEARATVRSIREAKTRSEANASIASALAGEGRWRDALSFAKRVDRAKNSESPEAEVMRTLVETERREWVREALPTLARGEEPLVLASLELQTGNFAAARAEAQRISDPERRVLVIEQIAQAIEEKKDWAELAVTARLIPPDAAKATNELLRSIHFKLASEWLAKAGAFDEALALVPSVSADERQELLAEIAQLQALSGDYRKSIALLNSIEPDWRRDVRSAIAVAKVLAGEEKLEQALASLVANDLRLDALEMLGEMLPDERRDEARAVLRQAVDLAARTDLENRDIEFHLYASMQARRGFFPDAHETALRIHDSGELLAAYGDIGIAQAMQGNLDEARRTFAIAESQARKYGFTGERHAQLTELVAKAGLLPEAFAHVQAMSQRDRSDYWFDQNLDAVIQGHLNTGQLRRAFEIAVLLSGHDSGNPHYFLVIAAAL